MKSLTLKSGFINKITYSEVDLQIRSLTQRNYYINQITHSKNWIY